MRERVQSKKLQIAPAQNINEATNWEKRRKNSMISIWLKSKLCANILKIEEKKIELNVYI